MNGEVPIISCGANACVALKTDGTAEAWGNPTLGGDATSADLTAVASFSCGTYACVALKTDGTAEAWGTPIRGGDATSADLTAVASISCGANACVALKTDGTAEAWGYASSGGDATSADLTAVASISCGEYACVALKTDGTAEAWGDPSYGGDATSADLTDIRIPDFCRVCSMWQRCEDNECVEHAVVTSIELIGPSDVVFDTGSTEEFHLTGTFLANLLAKLEDLQSRVAMLEL